MRIPVFLIALITLSLTVLAERTHLEPRANSDPLEDIRLGQEAARDAEKKLALITDPDVTAYISALGQKLVSKADNPYKFTFTFKVVDDKAINAFALPGGPVYVNRGAIEAADNEAEIAGVIGHEAGHVLLRHGVSESRKGNILGGIASIIGRIAGRSTLGQVIAAGGAFGANLGLMHYSRRAETEADLIGTQILYDNGYDPHAMAEFFDKLAKKQKGSKTEEFFSDHPIPKNRVANVDAEIQRIGPPVQNPIKDTHEFESVKKLLLAMPEPKSRPDGVTKSQRGTSSNSAPPAAPSAEMTDLSIGDIQLRYPSNWKPVVNGSNITIAPAGGISQNGALAYGMIIDIFTPQDALSLDQATDQFFASLQRNNPSMRIVRSRAQTRVDGWPAERTELSSDSPAGGAETDTAITLMRSPGQLQYFVLTAPARDMAKYDRTFQSIMNSVRLR